MWVICSIMHHTCILALVTFQATRFFAIVPSLLLTLESAMPLQSSMALKIQLAIQSFVSGAAFANVEVQDFSVDIWWRTVWDCRTWRGRCESGAGVFQERMPHGQRTSTCSANIQLSRLASTYPEGIASCGLPYSTTTPAVYEGALL
jgi:hypothetical protein